MASRGAVGEVYMILFPVDPLILHPDYGKEYQYQYRKGVSDIYASLQISE